MVASVSKLHTGSTFEVEVMILFSISWNWMLGLDIMMLRFICAEGGNGLFLWNVDNELLDCTASHLQKTVILTIDLSQQPQVRGWWYDTSLDNLRTSVESMLSPCHYCSLHPASRDRRLPHWEAGSHRNVGQFTLCAADSLCGHHFCCVLKTQSHQSFSFLAAMLVTRLLRGATRSCRTTHLTLCHSRQIFQGQARPNIILLHSVLGFLDHCLSAGGPYTTSGSKIIDSAYRQLRPTRYVSAQL
jgi:hypothetical protein